MAQQTFSIPLKDAQFPMMARNQSRTVINPSPGEVPDPVSIAYCENVMPTKEGYVSVAFKQLTTVITPLHSFVKVHVVYDTDRERMYMAWDSYGRVYIKTKIGGTWSIRPETAPPSSIANFFTSHQVSIATVNGITYICYGDRSLVYPATFWKIDHATLYLVPAVLTGVALATIVCNVSASGYHMVFTTNAVAWSSTLNPLDFVPSPVTGAGGGNIADIEGEILFVVPITDGFLIFSEANIVAATYTGNVRFPWKFRVVPNSRGGIDLDLTTYMSNSPSQFAYTTAGIQSITPQNAEVILPEVTDFLAGKTLETYNSILNIYQYTELTIYQTMQKKIRFIGSRYLVISYGITEFTHALIFDIALNRLGKIIYTHVDCFEYINITEQKEVAKEMIAFVNSAAETVAIDFNTLNETKGVLVLGKLQHVRSNLLTLEGVELEGTRQIVAIYPEVAVFDQVSLDGKNFTIEQATEVNTTEDPLRRFSIHTTGKNHSLAIVGSFDLTTVLVTYTLHGKR